jgi:O-methyltransferase
MLRQLIDRFRPAPLDPDRIVVDICAYRSRTTAAHLTALMAATRQVVRERIPGAFVDCGAWRGGSAMAMAAALRDEGVTDRELWLYDPFAGLWPADLEDPNSWLVPLLETVQVDLHNTSYPVTRIHYVQGPPAETTLRVQPGPIALLRVSADAIAAGANLEPLLSPGGLVLRG